MTTTVRNFNWLYRKQRASLVSLALGSFLLVIPTAKLFAQEPGGDAMRDLPFDAAPEAGPDPMRTEEEPSGLRLVPPNSGAAAPESMASDEEGPEIDGPAGACPEVGKTEFVAEKKAIQALWTQAHGFTKSGKHQKAVESLQNALEIARGIGSRRAEAMSQHLLGWANESRHKRAAAVAAYKAAAAIRRECHQRADLAKTLTNLCGVYLETAQYARAIEACGEAVPILTDAAQGSAELLAKALNNQGINYIELGQYRQAIAYLERASPLLEAADDPTDLAKLYHNIGYAYSETGDYAKAFANYETALARRRGLNDKVGIASTLNNIGYLRAKQGRAEEALRALQEALAIAREAADKPVEGRILDSLGDAYGLAKNFEGAQRAYNDALVIRKLVSDRRGERITLGNIGKILEAQGRDALAIVFYKEAVNVSESIRSELTVLPSEVSAAYTEKVSEIYRRLADLLLKHDRVIEAQRVLDLLKIQELEDYLQRVRGNKSSARGVPRSAEDRQITESFYNELLEVVQLAKAVEALETLDRELTDEEQSLRDRLDEKEVSLSRQFQRFLDSDEVLAWERGMITSGRRGVLTIAELSGLQDNLRQIDHGVLVYPLVLDDRLELVLTVAEGSPVHRTVAITRAELNKLVSDYLTVLRDPVVDVRPAAQKLYAKLIAPIEEALAAVNARTLIYVPDRSLRYVPLGALHNGKEWLIERYKIHRITSTTLSDFSKMPPKALKLLAGAYTSGDSEFSVGDETFRFTGLPFARVEVEGLSQAVVESTVLLDGQFTPEAIRRKARSVNAIHLATHAAFVVGQPDESFILFGNGERLTFKEVESDWLNRLRDVNLIVLSACETAVGGRMGGGEEIHGFGYLMEQAGADASIATLWPVDDGGTQILMTEFYKELLKGTAKAGALQQAQLALIHSDEEGSVVGRGVLPGGDIGPTLKGRLSHPYYWAPFILIGNGL